ncbi:arginine deiminase family protein [Acidobacteria bacterium AH-259-D05]|nr:arginine deiminase family protein [Acidobacteria bacterium AH-259-D05]
MDKPKRLAIVREVSDSYNECCLEYNRREPIDLELAREQHRAYTATLEQAGLRLVVLPADHRLPDACFVEDSAVILDDTAIITSMGTETRNREPEVVANCLANWMDLVYMKPPALLEGGDVLKIGKQIFVGESSRTNREGIAFLKAVACPKGYTVVAVPVRGALHLKTAVTYVRNSTLIAASSVLEEVKKYMSGFSVIELLQEYAYAANVLRLNKGVIIPSGYPTVKARIEKLGLQVKELEMSEFKKGEAGLTCLSIIIDQSSD